MPTTPRPGIGATIRIDSADSAGKLEEPAPGVYRYTFATDVTDPEQTARMK